LPEIFNFVASSAAAQATQQPPSPPAFQPSPQPSPGTPAYTAEARSPGASGEAASQLPAGSIGLALLGAAPPWPPYLGENATPFAMEGEESRKRRQNS